MPRPSSDEYAPYHEKYIALVPEDEILPVMRSEMAKTLALFKDVSEEEACRWHPPYTWSIKQVVGHIMDGERIFGYRALRFARGDATPLPGFEENDYASTGEFDRLPLSDLLAEWESVRKSTLTLFGNFPQVAWTRKGIANDREVSVLALAYILVGHERHHRAILARRLAGTLNSE